jgi:uncharacterized protein YgbK (DUF1537 family)
MSGHDLEAAIVADDLTGALDMAAPFASRGFATRLLLDVGRGTTDAETRVLALTSSSRDLTAQAAAENIRAAVGAALARNPKILIKKIDSTLRGDVVTAILTALQASGRRHALIATAVPSHGRAMRGGEVFVNGLSLRDNPLRFDGAVLPAPAPLPELLRASGSGITVHAWRRGHSSPPDAAAGLHAYVADCESDDDLHHLAGFALAHADSLLVVGASGLGAAIAKRISAGRPPNLASAGSSSDKTATSLFVIGSRTSASAEQIDRLREAGAREIVMPFPAIGMDLPNCTEPGILVIRPAPALRMEASREIAAALGQAVAELVRRLEVDAVVMSGGDTALAVFEALAVAQAVLLGELSPGVAIGTFPINGMPVTFVTKSGGFGDRDALLEISRSLKHR